MMRKQLLHRNPNHGDNLNSMRENDKWCDIIIKVDDAVIHAHKVILAANLKYFNDLFSDDPFKKIKQNFITISHVKRANLEAFVSYAYTGDILLTDSNALDLLITAEYLREDVIKEVCIQFLKKCLKAEEACQAYKFANIIESASLKHIAKKKILLNFRSCSQSVDYLEFDFDRLLDIFSDSKVQPAISQQSYFEGIIRWIMHNVEARKIHMEVLLNSIDISKLNADDLGDYLYRNTIEHNDEHAIMRDRIMSHYYAIKSQQMIKQRRDQLMSSDKKRQQMKKHVIITDQTLAIVGTKKREICTFQMCNFAEKKWFPLEEYPDVHSQTVPAGAVLNNKIYYTSGELEGEVHLNMFDPATKENTKLRSSSSILSGCASCACDRFLYLCGGTTSNYKSSCQFLKFNPETNSFETLTPMKTSKTSAAATFYQGCLHVVGGWSCGWTNMVEKYKPDTKEWITFPSMCQTRSGHAVAVLADKLYACGGGGTNENSVEVYDPCKNRWQLVASMNKKREYFLVVAHEGKLWAIGGDSEATVEVYDPLKDEWQMDHELSAGLEIGNPQGGFIPSSVAANAL